MIKDIMNIKAKQLMIMFFLYAAVVVSGVLVIFQFKPNLFSQMDAFKLILLGSSIAIPALVLNVLFYAKIYENEDYKNIEKKIKIRAIIFMGATTTIFVLFISLYFSYLFKWCFRTFSFIVIVLNLLIIVIVSMANNLGNESTS